MAALPTEVITEILSRLPVKSLVRFRCVCKSWDSFIKAPDFVKLHLNQTLISNSDRHLLLCCYSLCSAELDLYHNHFSFSLLHQPLKPPQAAKLIGSCNGVVCISDLYKTDIFLFNPLTKSHRQLPENQIPNPEYGFMLFGFGFGYDSNNDDYKVLRILQRYKNCKLTQNGAQLYSLNANSWKSIEGIPLNLFDSDFNFCSDCNGVLVNEALHFIVSTNELDSPRKLIASFDLHTESFSLIDCFKYDEFNLKSMLAVAELGGSLCMAVNYHRDGKELLERADFWVMKEYGNKESWVKLFSICQFERICCRMQLRPIVYSKNGRRVLCEIDSSVYCWYDLESKNVQLITPYTLANGPFTTVTFVGSLVSLGDKPHRETERGTLPRKN